MNIKLRHPIPHWLFISMPALLRNSWTLRLFDSHFGKRTLLLYQHGRRLGHPTLERSERMLRGKRGENPKSSMRRKSSLRAQLRARNGAPHSVIHEDRQRLEPPCPSPQNNHHLPVQQSLRASASFKSQRISRHSIIKPTLRDRHTTGVSTLISRRWSRRISLLRSRRWGLWIS